jgi:hypothetical protein
LFFDENKIINMALLYLIIFSIQGKNILNELIILLLNSLLSLYSKYQEDFTAERYTYMSG